MVQLWMYLDIIVYNYSATLYEWDRSFAMCIWRIVVCVLHGPVPFPKCFNAVCICTVSYPPYIIISYYIITVYRLRVFLYTSIAAMYVAGDTVLAWKFAHPNSTWLTAERGVGLFSYVTHFSRKYAHGWVCFSCTERWIRCVVGHLSCQMDLLVLPSKEVE